MKVIKFGGTSQSLEGYTLLISIIKRAFETDSKLVIVLSAVSGVTNLLEQYIQTKQYVHVHEIIKINKDFINKLNEKFNIFMNIDYVFDNFFNLVDEYFSQGRICLSGDCSQVPILHDIEYTDSSYNSDSSEEYDETIYNKKSDLVHLKASLLGYGEILSTNIFYALVSKVFQTDKIKLLNSYDFIKSSKETTKLYPSIEFSCSSKILEVMENSQIFVTQGFIASTPANKKIILGRGGSDTTGALIANAIDASEYQVWTDVDGIYTADPRVVKDAQIMKSIPYKLVQEMAGMGAKVMHPYSILPCSVKNIPIKILNTFNSNEGTLISNSDDQVYSVASQKNITLFKITSLSMWDSYGFVYDIFKKFSEKKVNVNIITTSQFSISTTTDEKDETILKKLVDDLSKDYEVEVSYNRAIVSLVSNNLDDILKKFNLTDIKKEITHFSSNNLTVSFVVDERDCVNDVQMLHDICLKN
jgi:aspartate kinase